MSEGLQRAQFTFENEHEIRYVAAFPEVGDLVAHGRELWLVARADIDELGLTVSCQRQVLSPTDTGWIELR